MRPWTRSDPPAPHRSPDTAPRSAGVARAADGARGAERAVLVGILLPDSTADLRDPLAELTGLAQAAGVQVVDTLLQKRLSLTPSCALGTGKVEELCERVRAHEANLVIFDNELLPRQIRGLEEAAHCRVLDRSELILDIFATRAKTREAQLQVELAQLEYTAPRLRGLWTHLERIAGAGGATSAGAVGGVGTRGPGERQIEIDRRIVRRRISHLKREIREIHARKRREVQARRDHFTVSLVGYTNSGKTTLLNRLAGTTQFAADMPFATLDTKTARWILGEGREVLLSDTVGFIRDLPHHLVASFRATLEEAIHADLLLHIVDISSPAALLQVQAADGVLQSLECDRVPQITLLNKADIADDAAVAEMLARNRQTTLKVSALTGEGLDRLSALVEECMRGHTAEVTLAVPHQEGRLIAEIARMADVLERRYEADHVEIDLRMNRTQLSQLCSRHPCLSVIRGSLLMPGEGDSPS